MNHEAPRLPATETAVRADLLLERGDLAGFPIELADDHEVATVRHRVEPRESGRGVRAERRDRIETIDATLIEVAHPTGAHHERPVALRAHHHQADAGMTPQPIDQPRIRLVHRFLGEPSRALGE